MKEWLNRATALLHASLEPPRDDLNERFAASPACDMQRCIALPD